MEETAPHRCPICLHLTFGTYERGPGWPLFSQFCAACLRKYSRRDRLKVIYPADKYSDLYRFVGAFVVSWEANE